MDQWEMTRLRHLGKSFEVIPCCRIKVRVRVRNELESEMNESHCDLELKKWLIFIDWFMNWLRDVIWNHAKRGEAGKFTKRFYLQFKYEIMMTWSRPILGNSRRNTQKAYDKLRFRTWWRGSKYEWWTVLL